MGATEFPGRRNALPLEQCDVVESGDPDEIQERMAAKLCSHELEFTEPGAQLNARFHFAQFGSIPFMFVRYGAPVRVKPAVTGFVAVQAHLTGDGKVACGAQQIYAHPQRIVVANHDEPLEMWLSADTTLILVRLEQQALVAKVADLVGDYLPLRFELGMDCAGGYARMWVDLLTDLVRLRGHVDAVAANLLAAPLTEECLITNLLKAARNNCSPLLATAPGRLLSSRLVCDVTQMIDADPRKPYTVSEIAHWVGTDVFTLDAAFWSCRGMTVLDYLRQARMKGAFGELREADPGVTTVEKIASWWGFVNVARFTAGYSAEFGETPLETLARAA